MPGKDSCVVLGDMDSVDSAGTPASVVTGSGVRKKGSKRRGAKWKRVKSRLAPTQGPGPGRPHKASTPASHKKKPENQKEPHWYDFTELAVAINSCKWDAHMTKEFENYQKLGVLQKATQLFDITPVSTYLAKKKGSEENQARRLCKQVRLIQQWCAAAVHLQNQQVIPFSMATASVAALARKKSSEDWATDLNLTSKNTAIKIVQGCVEHYPPTPFEESPYVMMYIFDQMYRVADVRAKKGHSTRTEKIQGDGTRQGARNQGVPGEGWERTVLINWCRLPIPTRLLGLSSADIQLLKSQGPITQSYDHIYPIISTNHVRAHLTHITMCSPPWRRRAGVGTGIAPVLGRTGWAGISGRRGLWAGGVRWTLGRAPGTWVLSRASAERAVGKWAARKARAQGVSPRCRLR